ncbi:amidase signature enzyme [Patellaria atrata CBS 101060]|uniref:amidase n=1 Tax=Patellaria atrata CBS 101060 TaxID=1346257 RepID=A0A9P4VRH9_9PEZI|nr:amidase signature enzyme [Patellaria atrata CBS 101060]
MVYLLDYFQHRNDCKRKQSERASKIASLPQTYRSPLASNERDILDAPIQKLVEDVQNKTLSPVDVLRTYGKVAIKAHEKTNCCTEILFPEAESWITEGQINLSGPLAGIPVSLKDSVQVKGFETSVGYSAFTGKKAEKDGSMVRLLKDAGAIPFVKTNLPITLLSFESFNDVWGRTTNPHNAKYSPGGSTGGEGAILAFGGSRIGIGSDVAGSVRAPAAWSGCYSLRCSTGRWPKMGVNTSMPGQEGIAAVFSPMARTLADLTYFSKSFIQMKPWRYDHSVHPLEWREDVVKEYREKKRLRIGVLRTDGVVDPSPACGRALDLVVTSLRAAGHDTFDITPPSPYAALCIASRLLNSDGCTTFSSFLRPFESSDPGAWQMRLYALLPRPLKYLHYLWVRYVSGDAVWAGLLRGWGPMSAAEQWSWVARREAYKSKWHDWWREDAVSDGGEEGEMDVIVTPPNATPALPHGAMEDAVASCGYTFLFNLLDYTCGIVPVSRVDAKVDRLPKGWDGRGLNGVARGAYKFYDAEAMEGLPVAVQVVGKRLEEEKVLAVMERVEDALEEFGGGRYRLMEVD